MVGRAVEGRQEGGGEPTAEQRQLQNFKALVTRSVAKVTCSKEQ